MTSMKKLLALVGATLVVLGCWSCDDEATTSAPRLAEKPSWVSVWAQNSGPDMALPQDFLPPENPAARPNVVGLEEVNIIPRQFTLYKKGGGEYEVRVSGGSSVTAAIQLLVNANWPEPLRIVGSYGLPAGEYEAISAEFTVRDLIAAVNRRLDIVERNWRCTIPADQATLSVEHQPIPGGLDLRDGASGAVVFNIPLLSWEWCVEGGDGGIEVGPITVSAKTD